MLWRERAGRPCARVMSALPIVLPAAQDTARSILSQLAAQGIDPGEAGSVTAGDLIRAERDAAPLVTLILEGVAARTRAGEALSLGLAGPGDVIGLDVAQDDGGVSGGVWLTPGRRIELPLAALEETLAPLALMELSLQALRSSEAAARVEIARHARLRVTDRLAALIADIHARSGETAIALRQSELAALLAVRRAGVSNACGELQARGAIRLRRGVIELIDLDALRQPAAVTRP